MIIYQLVQRVLFTFGIVVSVYLNASVFILLHTNKNIIMSHHSELIMMSLALCDVLQVGFTYPIQAYGYIKGTVLTSPTCQIGAFFYQFFVIVSVLHLVSLSAERYLTIVHTVKTAPWFTVRNIVLKLILPTWGVGIFWASLPLFGWSQYIPKPPANSNFNSYLCSMDLSSRGYSSKTYSGMFILFIYIAPLFAIITFFVKITAQLCRYRKLNQMVITKAHQTGIEIGRKMRKGGLDVTEIDESEQCFIIFVMMVMLLVTLTPHTVYILSDFG